MMMDTHVLPSPRTLFFMSLLVTSSLSLDCNTATYAKDFPVGSKDRWLYDNVAPGAECISMSHTQTEEDRCNEYILNVADKDWVQIPDSYTKGRDDLILSARNYSDHMTKDQDNKHVFSLDLCIQACRIISWCASADWSYSYDKCRLSRSHGDTTKQLNPDYQVTYVEKPLCTNVVLQRNNSLSYFRLGLKLIACMKYDMALTNMETALRTSGYNRMHYVTVALLKLLDKERTAASVAETSALINSLKSKQFSESSSYGENYLAAVVSAVSVAPNQITARLAEEFEKLFTDSKSVDSMAGTIAALAFKDNGNMDKFKSLLDAVLGKTPKFIEALYLYLKEYAVSRNTLLQQDINKIRMYTENLVEVDPNNVLAHVQALIFYYNMEESLKTIERAKSVLSTVTAALENGLISPTDYQAMRIMAYTYLHRSYLHRNDVSEAQDIEKQVKDAADSLADLDRKSVFEALYNRQRASRYFQLAFTQSPQRSTLIETKLDQKSKLVVSDSLETIGKVSWNMYRQAIVTQQIRNGSASNYVFMIAKWENLRDGPNFKNSYKDSVDYNIYMLQTEFALTQANSWEEVMGPQGYLNKAALLLETLPDFIVMEVEEMVAYATMKFAEKMSSPIGLPGTGAKIPKDLSALQAAIEGSWPKYTPSKLNIIAYIQLAMGKVDDCKATLAMAKDKMISAEIVWLLQALERADNAAEHVSINELLPIPKSIPANPSFDDDDTRIFAGLDDGWNWRPDVTAMAPCTAFRYRNRENSKNPWKTENKKSIKSTQTAYYFATNSYSCKQRCLFEKKFECKSFTFGFSRCLLHDQIASEASSSFSDLADETYFQVPDCTPEDTNAYSQLLLGGKALSNQLGSLAMQKFDEASELDPLMGLPKILKAMLVHHSGCQPAASILKQTMITDEYETLMWKSVNNSIYGQVQDARNDMRDLMTLYPDDRLVSYLYNQLMNQVASKPEIAGDYIAIISRDIPGSGVSIKKLEAISKLSPRSRLYKAYILYLDGKWAELSTEIDTFLADTSYVGFGENSPDKLLAMQLKHYALVQRGKFSAAKALYQTYKGHDLLGAYMYAAQIYTQMINATQMPVLDEPEIIQTANPPACSAPASIVALTMKSVKNYMTANVEQSVKDNEQNKLFTKLNAAKPGEFTDMWKDVSKAYYSLSEPAGLNVANQILQRPNARKNLSPEIVSSAGVQLIHPREVVVWATLSQSTMTNFAQLAEYLNKTEEERPRRTVTLWLRYTLFWRWMKADPTKTTGAVTAAKDLLNHWSDADRLPMYRALSDFVKYPDSTKPKRVNHVSMEDAANLPEWAIYTIIGVAGGILLAIVISCLVWMACRKGEGEKKQKVYSGSIYSASTTGNGENILPGHGEVMYGGQRNDGFSFRQ